MKFSDTLLDESSLPNEKNPHFVRVFGWLKNGDSPSDWPESLCAYERMGVLQACVDKVINNVRDKVSEDFEVENYPSQPSINLQDTIREFMRDEWFEEWNRLPTSDELEIIINEVIRQVEMQWVAWFDYLEDDLLWTTMHFIRA